MNKLLLEFKNIDINITNLMRRGIKFSFLLIIFASIILLTYDFLFTYPIIYYAGFSLFKTSLCNYSWVHKEIPENTTT